MQNQVTAITSTSVPFYLRKSWFERFQANINTGLNLLNLELVQGDENVVLPMLTTLPLRYSLQVATLSSMTNYYSPGFGVIDKAVNYTPDLLSLTPASLAELKKHDCVKVAPLSEEQAESWQQIFAKVGFTGQRYNHSINWFHEGITDIEQYWSLRPPRLLNTVKRKQAQMARAGGFNTVIFSTGEYSQLIQYLIDYHHVYYSSWKQKEPYPAFIDTIAEIAWSEGELRIGIIYHHKKPIAAQIWFVSNASAYIYKLAHIESYARFSPGTVLTAAMMEHCITVDKVNRIDFLTGNDNYKKDWMSDCRPLCGLYLCNKKTWAGRWLSVLNTASQIGKRLSWRS